MRFTGTGIKRGGLVLVVLAAMGGEAWAQRNWARWDLAPSTEVVRPTQYVALTIGPTETLGGEDLTWWQLEHQPSMIKIQVLSDKAPMRFGGGTPTRIARYLVDDPDHPAVEYVDARTGEALLPRYQFMETFIPRESSHGHSNVNGFYASGRYLGRSLVISGTGTVTWTPMSATPLELNPDLLVGGYLSTPDFNDLVNAGLNYFPLVSGEAPYSSYHVAPIFYSGPVVAAEWPEQFYRSTYLGPTGYLDEPTVAAYDPLESIEAEFPEEAGQFLEAFLGAQARTRERAVQSALLGFNVEVGAMEIDDPDLRSWESVGDTGHYHYAGGVTTFIQKARFNLTDFNTRLQDTYQVGVAFTAPQMFDFDYAAARGAARPFIGTWGVSIEAETDPALRLDAAVRAYDLGALCVFAGSGLAPADAIAVAQAVHARAAAQPRGDLADLLLALRTAIVLPYGYAIGGGGDPLSADPLHASHLWGQLNLDLNNANVFGATHRRILQAAVEAAVSEMQSGRAYDFVIDSGQWDPTKHVPTIYINPDGSATPVKGLASLEHWRESR